MMKRIVTLISIGLFSLYTNANDVNLNLNLPLKPIDVIENGQSKKYIEVNFDLQWQNSWRYGNGSNGKVVHIAIRNGGSGYADGEYDITFSGGNATVNATAKVKVLGSKVTEVLQFTEGADYELSPTDFSGMTTSGDKAIFDVHIAPWWDAVWVFLKYKKNGDNEWRHAALSYNGHHAGQGTQMTLTPGLVNESLTYHAQENPVGGLFFYRSQSGVGTSSISNAVLRWDYELNGLSESDEIEVKLFGIEMVYVPEGAFYVGSGGSENGGLYSYPSTNNPFLVASAGAIEVGSQNGKLYYNNSGGQIYGDQDGPVPSGFPTGYSAFYTMKYEISQQQFVDFLNALSVEKQESLRGKMTSNMLGVEAVAGTYLCASSSNGVGLFRCGIRIHTPGDLNAGVQAVFETLFPYLPIDGLNYSDLMAFLDWSALRPMSELEYEKACRGQAFPTPMEYAWGTSGLGLNNMQIGNDALKTEYIVSGLATNGSGNASHHETTGTGTGRIEGPVRSGIFATNQSDRTIAGASFYGVMELTGNIAEIVVSIGGQEGRKFRHVHGDGNLIGLYANVESWPGADENDSFFVKQGSQHMLSTKGGHYATSSGVNNSFRSPLLVSTRGPIGSGTIRTSTLGGRGARSAPNL